VELVKDCGVFVDVVCSLSVRMHIMYAVDIVDPNVQYVRFLLHSGFDRHHLLPYVIKSYLDYFARTFDL